MSEIPGLETIRGLTGEPPKTISVNKYFLSKQQVLMQWWNTIYIAVIPFCYKCAVALVWHSPPDGKDNEVLFHCPKCRREWHKALDWNEPDKKKKSEEKPK